MISVIVTVYNLERYCGKCIKSILRQTYKNIEVIIVNDGSTDGSQNILEQYQRNDKRIRIINKKNGGVSSARNVGIASSQGEYICFVDGDDIVAHNMLDKLLERMTPLTALAIGKMIRITEQNPIFSRIEGNSVLTDTSSAVKMLINGEFPISVCCVLFRKDLVGQIRFSESIHNNEDKLFLYQYLLKNRNYCVIRTDNALYGYYVRKNSASRNIPWEKRYDIIRVSKYIFDTIEAEYPEYREMAYNAMLSSYLSVLKITIMDSKENKSSLKIKKMRKEILSLQKPKNCRFQLKLEYKILKIGIIPYLFFVKTYYSLLPESHRYRRNSKITGIKH